jgi:IS1 family transposase
METIGQTLTLAQRVALREAVQDSPAIVGMALVASRARTANGRLSRVKWARQARQTLAVTRSTS